MIAPLPSEAHLPPVFPARTALALCLGLGFGAGLLLPGPTPSIAQDSDFPGEALSETTIADETSGPTAERDADSLPASPAADLLPALPPVSRYESIWKNSPFELEAAPDVAAASKQSFARDFSLAGMLRQGESIIVYIVNRRTRETHRVASDGKGEGGFRLRSIEGDSNNVREIEATIEKDGEVARLTYDKSVTETPAAAAKPARAAQDAAAAGRSPVEVARAGSRPAASTGNRALDRARARQKAAAAGQGQDTAEQAAPGAAPPKTSSSRRRIVLPKPVNP